MEWLVKMIDWFQRETWWRHYYKRVTLDEKTTWGGNSENSRRAYRRMLKNKWRKEISRQFNEEINEIWV